MRPLRHRVCDFPALPLRSRLRVGVARPTMADFERDATAASELSSPEVVGFAGPLGFS
ncbi:MAG: hypothetical protein PVF54_01515 [Anaerolineae bacterium]